MKLPDMKTNRKRYIKRHRQRGPMMIIIIHNGQGPVITSLIFIIEQRQLRLPGYPHYIITREVPWHLCAWQIDDG